MQMSVNIGPEIVKVFVNVRTTECMLHTTDYQTIFVSDSNFWTRIMTQAVGTSCSPGLRTWTSVRTSGLGFGCGFGQGTACTEVS